MNIKELLVIFLDFDGVLHPTTRDNFELLPNFLSVLDLFPSIKVVISSNWKNSCDYAAIFGKYANRIIGNTTTIKSGTRESEILLYVKDYKVTKFIALDDDCRNELFSDNCEFLFKTDYYRGLDITCTSKLIEFIRVRFGL
jgi:hypothetical protein